MADDSFLSKLLSSLTPEPFDRELDEKAYQLAGGDETPTAQRDTHAMVQKLREERNKAPLPSDGDLVRNELMKGTIPPSNIPNFSANKDPMWFSPQGPIRPDQMPPSPLKPEIQEQMLADATRQNKGLPSLSPNSFLENIKTASVSAPRSSIPKTPSIKPKKEEEEESTPEMAEQPTAPKQDDETSMLKKLIESTTDDSELRKAMEDQQRNEAIAMMLRGAVNIGGGLSGQSSAVAGSDYLKDFVESSKGRTANVRELMKNKQEKVKFAMDTEKGMLDLTKAKLGFSDEKMARDPGSKTSQLARESMRDALNRIGKKDLASKISEDMSARQLEDRFGEFNIQNMVTAYEGQQNRLAMEKERSAARKDAQDAKKSDKQDSNIMALRKELTTGNVGKVHANYLNAERNERSISDFAKNPTGYSDYGTLMGSLKVLQGDESVVREAEIRLGQQAGSLSQQIQNVIDGKIKGTSLQPKQRQAILTAVGILKNRARQQYQEVIEPILQQADKMNIQRSELLPKNMQEKELKTSPFDTDAAKAELERRKKGNK